jgi:hypothetical protein
MVRELGVDAAEAPLKEAAHVIAPKAHTANKSNVRFFDWKVPCLGARFRCDRPCEALRRASGRSVQRASHCQRHRARSADGISCRRAQVHAADRQPRRRAVNIARAIAKHFATPVATKKAVTAKRVIRELPSSSTRQEKRVVRACCDARTMGPIMSRYDDSDLGTCSDCPTSGKERTAGGP